MKKNKNKLLLVIIIAAFFSLINYLCYPLVVEMSYEQIEIPIVKRTLESNEIIKQDDIEILITNTKIYENDIELDSNAIIGKKVKDGYKLCKGLAISKEAIEDIDEQQITAQQKYLYVVGIVDDLAISDYLFVGGKVDIYFYADGYDENISRISGLLAKQCEIVQISENKDSVTLLLDVEDYDYCVRSELIGQRRLLISNNTNSFDYYENDYFSVEMTKSYIDKYTGTLRYETIPNQ